MGMVGWIKTTGIFGQRGQLHEPAAGECRRICRRTERGRAGRGAGVLEVLDDGIPMWVGVIEAAHNNNQAKNSATDHDRQVHIAAQ
jgi:hypothetical protein